MIIEEAVYLEHFGKKGMRWGQRKRQRIADKALSPKGHKERAKRHSDPKNLVRMRGIELATQDLVQRALAEPNTPFHVINKDRTLIVTGRDFAEVVIGRIGNARIDPWNDNLQRVTKNKPGRR